MLSNKNGIVQKFTTSDHTAPFMFKGRVINVRPATLSVDIYIPYTNKTYYGVYFGEGVLSKTYRSGGLPDIDSEVIVVSYSRTDAPVVIACVPPNQFNSDDSVFEFIYPGEYQIMSSGKSYFKADKGGNAYLGAASSASETKTENGTSIDYQEKDINITNFSKKELRTEIKDGIISIYGTSDFYEKSNISVYSADDILNDPSLKNKVIEDAKNIMTIIFGGESAGESPSGRTIFDCLEMVISRALSLVDFENEFEIYKSRAGLIKLSSTGNRLRVETFGENNFSIKLFDDKDTLITGITMGGDGGHLIGVWNSETAEGE